MIKKSILIARASVGGLEAVYTRLLACPNGRSILVCPRFRCFTVRTTASAPSCLRAHVTLVATFAILCPSAAEGPAVYFETLLESLAFGNDEPNLHEARSSRYGRCSDASSSPVSDSFTLFRRCEFYLCHSLQSFGSESMVFALLAKSTLFQCPSLFSAIAQRLRQPKRM